MTVAEYVARLRRLVAEPTETTYDDEALEAVLARYSVMDSDGYEPDDDGWTETYDVWAAAAEIWEEKAAAVADEYGFSADGHSLNRNQRYEQYMKHARRCAARRHATAYSVSPVAPEAGDKRVFL